jgi:outer membrane protein TolC
MKYKYITIIFNCVLMGLAGHSFAQQRNLDYFLTSALQNDPNIRQNINQQQFYNLQRQLIIAQNKLPQVTATSDLLLAPNFGDGRGIFIATSKNPPSNNAFGYDYNVTNGGLYAGQVNFALNLFNKRLINTLQQQNIAQADINNNARGQIEHDVKKNVTDQYVQVYQSQQQEDYLKQIIEEVKGRKITVEALVKRGLLQQSDYLLLEIEQNTRENELNQARITEVSAYGALKVAAVIADTAMVKLDEPQITLVAPPTNYYFRQKFRLDSLNIVSQLAVFNTRYLPQLSLNANTGFNSADYDAIQRHVGLQGSLHLNIPLYDGHQRKINESQLKISQQSLTYARDNFGIQQRNYLQSIRKQIELFNQNITQINSLISKQELLLRLDREKLQSGQLSIIEYVKSIQDYSAARQSLTVAKIQLLLLSNQYNYYNW